jgi:hypothetical protein
VGRLHLPLDGDDVAQLTVPWQRWAGRSESRPGDAVHGRWRLHGGVHSLIAPDLPAPAQALIGPLGGPKRSASSTFIWALFYSGFGSLPLPSIL